MGLMIYNYVPIWFMAVLVGLVLFLVTELAWFVGRKRMGTSHDTPFDIALGPAFTMVALLLGFVFSMALQRYDARVAAVQDEANAIRETFIMSGVLPDTAAAELRSRLRSYVEARLAFALADADPAGREQAARSSRELQREMVDIGVRASRQDPSSGNIPLVLSALNGMISASAGSAGALAQIIPPAVMVMLVLQGLIASALMGVRLGSRDQRGTLAGALLAGMLALIMGTVVDLDQPQRGFIRVSLEPLRVMQQVLIEPQAQTPAP